MTSAYDRLIQHVREANILAATEALLDWDSETYMPPRGVAARAEQLSLVAALAHERRTSPVVGELLSQLDGRADDETQAANIREIRRTYERAVRIPTDLVRRIARATTLAKDAWGKARNDDDFAAFAPHLTELLDLKRQVADLIGWRGERYDALLDEYEPGMSTAQVAAVFAALRQPLTNFVKQVTTARKKPDAACLHRHYPREAQAAFCRMLAEAIGFDFSAGRIDVSKHPFCSGTGPGDVRLTTRYYEDFFSASVFGVLHETGHGLYEQGLDAAHAFTPMGQAVSLGIHESQSRMWENFIGRSRPFWERYYGEAQRAFPAALGGVPLDEFYGAINAVAPSLIRVEADEVTYNLHIILRFELERDLLDGRLEVRDLPGAWNAKMKELLGIRPGTNREGCLQDIHWSMAAFGYFPTYALGNLYAAQLYSAMRGDLAGLDDLVRQGEFRPLLEWLRANIHRHGQRYRAGELIERITGRPLSIEAFLAYIRRKFTPLYGL